MIDTCMKLEAREIAEARRSARANRRWKLAAELAFWALAVAVVWR